MSKFVTGIGHKEDLKAGESNVTIELFRDGQAIHTQKRHNTVLNVGKQDLVKRLVTAPTKYYNYMKLGRGSTGSTSAQTGLVGTTIASTNRTCNTAAQVGRTATFIRTWITTDFSATGVEEAVIGSQKTFAAGTHLCRTTFTTVNKSQSDTFKITWTVKIN